jgi:hypothetical protein
MACNGHTGDTEHHSCTCDGHSNPNDSDSCTCNGHSGGTEQDTCTCYGHTGSCSSHSGYVPAVTITFTNETVSPGEEIDAQEAIHELLSKLNDEANRRHDALGTNPISLTLDNPIEAAEVRAIRDLYIDITGNANTSPISNTQIAAGQPVLASTIENMKDGLVADAADCRCDCNYSCTCNCNYDCTCNCNYTCTCD